MAKEKKKYRKRVTVNGKQMNMRFETKKEMADWYATIRLNRKYRKSGLPAPAYDKAPLLIDYARTWLKTRMNFKAGSTTYSDEQRLRDYILPDLGNVPIDQVTPGQIRSVLNGMVSKGLSPSTATRVKAILSKMMNDALNEEPPVIRANPVLGLKFESKREGEHTPNTLSTAEAVHAYLKAAKEEGAIAFLIVAITLGSGGRKSEVSALQWGDFDPHNKTILFQRHVEQVSLTIKPGTKAGKKRQRLVPIPSNLVKILMEYRKQTKFPKTTDFIICDEDGDWIRPRPLHDINDAVRKRYGFPLKIHEMRHTFGRLFVLKTGNQKAVQSMLGHVASSTTDLYTKLSGVQVIPFAETMGSVFDSKEGNESKAALAEAEVIDAEKKD